MPNGYSVAVRCDPQQRRHGGNETTDKEGNVTGDTDKAGDAGTIVRAQRSAPALARWRPAAAPEPESALAWERQRVWPR